MSTPLTAIRSSARRGRGECLRALAGTLVVAAGLACGGADEPVPAPARGAALTSPEDPAAAVPARRQIFVDRAAEVGLDFVHFAGVCGAYHMAEVLGGGGALFDYDRDGDLDLYLLQGCPLGAGKTVADSAFPAHHPEPLTDRLYRNELVPTGRLHFTDLTAQSGFLAPGYGQSLAVADYDGDGWLDVYVTNVGANYLLHNNGPGPDGVVTFRDATAEAGVADERWSVPAAFFDYDRDGWPDLYVGNYIVFDAATAPRCKISTGAVDYCGPDAFPNVPDRLFHNRGDGTFEDVTAAVGLSAGLGPALGVVVADFNGDGWTDVYVANDHKPNHLWVNHQGRSFTDEALLAGCSLNASGEAESSMGVDAGDFDGDGDADLFMGHLVVQTNTLYRNDGGGMFEDVTSELGLGAPSRLSTTFGAVWIDYDNDGWLDLYTANGAVMKIEALARIDDPYPFHQLNQLYRNLGGQRFEEVTARAGAVFDLSEVSRAAAAGDVDDDGDTDLLLVNNNGPVRLLVNQVGNERPWLGLQLVAGEPEKDVPGARAALVRDGRPVLWRWVRIHGSFASVHDPRLLFGLGDDPRVDGVRVWWPDGLVEQWSDVAVGRYTRLRRGSGRKVT